jgi:hypothetical protein
VFLFIKHKSNENTLLYKYKHSVVEPLTKPFVFAILIRHEHDFALRDKTRAKSKR